MSDHGAPGRPGIPPRWTSSAKSGVGTALSDRSPVWFTLSHGILNEIYYPRVDLACTRDAGLIVTDGDTFFSEEKRHAVSKVQWLADGAPAYRLINTCLDGRYRIVKEVVSDPGRPVVLQRVSFSALKGVASSYRLHVLLSPHLGNRGRGNTAWVGEAKGVPMLFAERSGTSLALACSLPWRRRSVGYVGASDGWLDLLRHKEMRWTYDRATDGNVALTGEIDLSSSDGVFVLALGFGRSPAEAAHHARASLLEDFDGTLAAYVEGWQRWQQRLHALAPASPATLYRISAAVVRTHEAKDLRGGIIASLAVPWGFAKGDDDLGGYHLIWPRDLVEAAGGLLAAGAVEDVRRVLHYLHITQEADGHWPQNMWLDGTPYWDGVQMDETALPILLVDLARREHALDPAATARLWPMVRRAAGFIVRNGPVTQQDRWEEDPGYSPFTVAAEIAGLLVAADLAAENGESAVARYLRETADAWEASVERWMYATATDEARRCGVEGYYVRIAPLDRADAASPLEGFVPIKNRPPGAASAPAATIVSPDALALVRFGLRAATDPRIADTVVVIDAHLRIEMPAGPAWHRYNEDGYGEREDGAPFDGTGIGRAWPLLTGERAHYELAAGCRETAGKLLRTLEATASPGGLLPEQIWDAADVPGRELFFGRPSGSAMPLVWAHAEYLKLCRSLEDGRVFDMPPQTYQRYVVEQRQSPHAIWRFNHKCQTMPAGKELRIEVLTSAVVHWSSDGWKTTHDTPTGDTSLCIHVVDLSTHGLEPGSTITFTFYWPDAARWEGVDFEVTVVARPRLMANRRYAGGSLGVVPDA